ncbi:hypothetical protein WMY93_030309 [Mugilogobius chulae]|uniref:Link domain-containing protein n=1 Tax=Mugilogobius chulae TaxID=88201 RepID=A0AAW0MQX9_9GOBI
MERLGLVWFLIWADFSSALDHSLITVSSVSPSGVFLLTGPKGQYQFNFTEAAEACLFMNASMATKAQLQTGVDQGLEACRFGWVSDQTAAVLVSPLSRSVEVV